MNALNLIDCYKSGHQRQYPEKTELVFSNLTPRKSRIPGVDKYVFFGLRYFIEKYLRDEFTQFFKAPREYAIAEHRRRMELMLGKGAINTSHLEALHNLGYLPLHIKALPEGSVVPIGVPPLVFYNTHKDFAWLTNYIETIMSVTLWKPITSATIAKQFYSVFSEYAELTGGSKEFVQFQGHDFSFRGMGSLECAMLSGAAHLLYFRGTDTVPALDFIENYYGMKDQEAIIGVSCPATEHSVMCAGEQENELETFSRMLDIYPTGLVSIVSDTWDYYGVLTNILPQLKSKIMARNGKTVIRPDSSRKTPYEIIVGDKDAEPGSPEFKGSIQLLWELFGGTVNAKGYKELDSHIGLIYGDSITVELAQKICHGLMEKGFASTNWVAGIGSYTYNYNTRDTLGIAIKATYVEVDGKPRQIFKNPKTDDGTKRSLKGLINVVKHDLQGFIAYDQAKWDDLHYRGTAFRTVFYEGDQDNYQYFDEIREIATGK